MQSTKDFDWSSTPLGARENWPAALCTVYAIMSTSSFAMCATWGPARTLLYNDAYVPFLGERHPAALGMPIQDVWPEVWPTIGPLVEKVLNGVPVHDENMHLAMTRNGYPEDTYWTFSYSPLADASGMIAGFLNVAIETTQLVTIQKPAIANAERVQLALAAGAIIGTWFWDLPSNRFTVDEAFARNFGLDPALGRDGLSLQQVVETVHPDDIDSLLAAIDETISRGGPYAHQYRVRRADGRYYWLEANGRVELAADGSGLSFPGVLIDVEERRAIEGERDRAIARVMALNDELEQKVIAQTFERGRTWQVTPDLLGVINQDGYLEASNPAWQTTLGWSAEELASSHFLTFVNPDDQAESQRVWERVKEAGEPALGLENRFACKDGGWRWLSWVAVPSGGKTYCSARDVTREKRNRAELRKRTAERDRLWESTNDLMGSAGFDGYFKSLNPAWSQLLGWETGQLLAAPFIETVVEEDRADVGALLERLSNGGKVSGFTSRLRCKSGEARSFLWTVASDPAGAIVHFVGRDVTAQHMAEESLRQSQKMEAIGQLTGGIAHDFNNLLAGISGSLELMQLRIEQGRFHELSRYMSSAETATRRAAALTHRLLAFSRRQTLLPKPTDANLLIAGMLEMIQRTVGPAIRLESELHANPWTALVDASQLENTLLNLCINARDAMPNGGTIRTTTQNLWIDAGLAATLGLPEGQYLSLAVQDNGVGMPAQVVARAVEPFFTTKPLGEGTGLGLSMAYGFAKQSGGQMRITSTVGEGTVVTLYLPRHDGKAEVETTPSPLTGHTLTGEKTGRTALVVDDEPAIRMLVGEVLEELGLQVIEAADSADGLSILQSDAQVDLLISDVGLPGGMNGRQMADAGLARRPAMPVLLITGYAENALLTDGQLGSGMAVLTKPFTLEALASRVRELLA
ncbi:PAS domain S-box-containing protein [Pseudomonas flavescens]|uniref:histidine kinase n=1 Tax=Phytopseudomonas flavescens TaxID=29435 RepID=A0A1G8EZA4_9GAMM|nr:PAS domain-containing protein [Pseudomonas flavescens]SDH75164.1 PAS domain S-box-containing protein [Pseudomonas flavescens]